MVDRTVFDRRLAKLEEFLADLRSLSRLDLQTFLADHTSRTLAERWLHLAVECTLDLAHHLIAARGWSSPRTYRETFQILAGQGVLEAEHATQMEDWAGMRNILVHVYLEIDHEILYRSLTEELDQLERFAAAVAKAALES